MRARQAFSPLRRLRVDPQREPRVLVAELGGRVLDDRERILCALDDPGRTRSPSWAACA